MKRSEAIIKIANEISLCSPGQYIIADRILTLLEQAGMLPPYKTKDRQYPDSQLTHTWEPEKEEE